MLFIKSKNGVALNIQSIERIYIQAESKHSTPIGEALKEDECVHVVKIKTNNNNYFNAEECKTKKEAEEIMKIVLDFCTKDHPFKVLEL